MSFIFNERFDATYENMSCNATMLSRVQLYVDRQQHVVTTSGSVDGDAHMIRYLKQLDSAVQKWFYWTDKAGNCFEPQRAADYSSQQLDEINLLKTRALQCLVDYDDIFENLPHSFSYDLSETLK